MSVWITKLALTKGIVEVKEENVTRHDRGMIRCDIDGYVQLYYKPDWHDTKKEARTRAEQMRLKKVAFLTRKLANLKALKF